MHRFTPLHLSTVSWGIFGGLFEVLVLIAFDYAVRPVCIWSHPRSLSSFPLPEILAAHSRLPRPPHTLLTTTDCSSSLFEPVKNKMITLIVPFVFVFAFLDIVRSSAVFSPSRILRSGVFTNSCNSKCPAIVGLNFLLLYLCLFYLIILYFWQKSNGISALFSVKPLLWHMS